MASLFAEFPNLLNRAILLVNLIDHCTAVFHGWHGRLLKAAAVTVIESSDINYVFIALGIDTESGVLRPGVVKVTFALAVFTFDRLTVLIKGFENIFWRDTPFPAVRGGEDPLNFLVPTNFDDGRLMAGTNDDRVICRIIVDGVDVSPVTASPYAGDITECVGVFPLLARSSAERDLPA